MFLKHFVQELKRRNVFKVAGVYAVAGWVLIQIAATTFPFFKIPDWGVRLVVILVILGFPIALILAWAFEMTPDGVKRTEEVPLDQSISHKTGQKINSALAVVLVLAIGFIFYQQFFKKQTSVSGTTSNQNRAADTVSTSSKSIAVLPFENLSTDKSNAYFADGMQDMILTKLADIGDLKVISRTSTAKYSSHPDNLLVIAKQLGVSTILEGSVQKVGKQVLINLQLINAKTDNHIWAKAYTRTLKNVFGVEGEVAGKVAEALKAKLTARESNNIKRIPTTNSEAYQLYLKALYEQNQYYETGLNSKYLPKAMYYLQQAVKKDSSFALAYARLAYVKSKMIVNKVQSDNSLLITGFDNARKALKLQPDLAEGHHALGLLFILKGKVKDGLQELNKAAALEPNNADIQNTLGEVRITYGNWKKANEEFTGALRLDPRNGLIRQWVATTAMALGHYREAQQSLENGLALNPDNHTLIDIKCEILMYSGQPHEAFDLLEKLPDDFPYKYTDMAKYYYWIGNYQKSFEMAEKITHLSDFRNKGIKALYIGRAQLALGNLEKGRKSLLKSIAEIQNALKQHPKSAILYNFLALGQSYLYRQQEALSTIEKALSISRQHPFGIDSFICRFLVTKAEIYAHFGNAKEAKAVFDKLFKTSGHSRFISPEALRNFSTFDPIRNTPVFQKLLKKYPVGSQS